MTHPLLTREEFRKWHPLLGSRAHQINSERLLQAGLMGPPAKLRITSNHAHIQEMDEWHRKILKNIKRERNNINHSRNLRMIRAITNIRNYPEPNGHSPEALQAIAHKIVARHYTAMLVQRPTNQLFVSGEGWELVSQLLEGPLDLIHSPEHQLIGILDPAALERQIHDLPFIYPILGNMGSSKTILLQSFNLRPERHRIDDSAERRENRLRESHQLIRMVRSEKQRRAALRAICIAQKPALLKELKHLKGERSHTLHLLLTRTTRSWREKHLKELAEQLIDD